MALSSSSAAARPLPRSLLADAPQCSWLPPPPPRAQEEGSAKAQQALATVQAEGYDVAVAAEVLLACGGDVHA